MNELKVILVGLLMGVVLVSGCTQQPPPESGEECGDGTCDPGETSSNCPADCPSTNDLAAALARSLENIGGVQGDELNTDVPEEETGIEDPFSDSGSF